ncbi:hypothetical protein AC56_1476 [Escherichia coli 1-182-04_S3_C3]|nr:hypothetical protein AC56_1476 [Escherichia coli 1-182-04_S3_C3]EZK02230.1 hypothetical protein AB99_1471 [Escherichia coli 1-182-04_S3_C1]
MMSLWDALRMNMMISYQELVRTFLSCQSSGITTEHSRFVSVSLSLCWHNGDDSSCS